MKKFLCLFLIGLLVGIFPLLSPALAQTPTSGDDLYYTFYGQRIPLVQRRDRIAVLLTPQPSGTRGGVSPYQQLQQTLLGQPSGSRSLESAPALEVSVRPLGSRYAVIELPSLDAELVAAVEARLQQPYIEATVPVLSRASQDDTILLPNQIIVSFEPGTPQSQVQLTLNRHRLDIIRPLRFSPNRYLVL